MDNTESRRDYLIRITGNEINQNNKDYKRANRESGKIEKEYKTFLKKLNLSEERGGRGV